MIKANLHDAKTHLSKLVDAAVEGEEIIICKAGVPLVRLVALKTPKERIPGKLKGLIRIEKDFDTLPKEFMEYFK